jgi:hypothetical protein
MKPAQPVPRPLLLTCGHSVFVRLPDDKSMQRRVVPFICPKCGRQLAEHRESFGGVQVAPPATYQTKG